MNDSPVDYHRLVQNADPLDDVPPFSPDYPTYDSNIHHHNQNNNNPQAQDSFQQKQHLLANNHHDDEDDDGNGHDDPYGPLDTSITNHNNSNNNNHVGTTSFAGIHLPTLPESVAVVTVLDPEWIMRMQAFFCAAMLGIGTHFAMHTVGPLKDVLKQEMNISNTQFSLLQSSLTLFPTIVPLLGGLLVERFGTGPSSVVFTSIVVLGQAIVVLGCGIQSVKLMIIGFCSFGIGAAPITIIQETMWVQYFEKKGLALVLALGLTTGKLAGFLALATAAPLATLQPFGFVTPFIVSLVISILAWFMNIGFLLLVKKPKRDLDTISKITILLKSKQTKVGWREIYGFSSMFWSLLFISFLVGSSWTPFMHQASSILKHRYQLSDTVAAWEASLTLAVPLLVYPFLGIFIDRVGQRAWLLLVTASLLVLTHMLLLIPYSSIPIPPEIPMLLFSLSLSLGSLAIVTSMPIITKHVPTGLGLHRSIDNIGATLVGTLTGMIQDMGGLSNNGTDVAGEDGGGNIFEKIYHHFFPIAIDLELQEKLDIRLVSVFLVVALLLVMATLVFLWGDYHWRDGEGGNSKTGLVNGVYFKKQKNGERVVEEDDEEESLSLSVANQGQRRGGRGGRRRQEQRERYRDSWSLDTTPRNNSSTPTNSRQSNTNNRQRMNRRQHEVLEAMMSEPIFDIDDEEELDAEEVSMTEINASTTGQNHKQTILSSTISRPLTPTTPPSKEQSSSSSWNSLQTPTTRNGDGSGSSNSRPRFSEGEDDQEFDYTSDGSEGSTDTAIEDQNSIFNVQIDDGEVLMVSRWKRNQAHFCIGLWLVMLVTSWVLFGIGIGK